MFRKASSSPRLDERLVTVTDPKSIASEQYRLVRSRIEHLGAEKGLRSLVVTSPVVGDGKSVTIANLALSMAQSKDKRVALVDCDLRRPRLHTLLGAQMKEGVVEVMQEKSKWEDVMIPLQNQRLFFLPAGKTVSSSPDWLSSSQMKKLIATLSQQFDYVLFDTPPILPLADASILGAQVDGSLLVLRAGKTTRETLTLAMQSVDLTNWIGVILNGVDFIHSAQYGSVYAMYQKTYYGKELEARGVI